MEQSLAIKGIEAVKILGEVEDAFFKLTGIDFTFIDLKNKPVVSPKYADRFCKALLSSKKKSRALDLINKACEQITNLKKPYIYDCFGLTQAIIPIIVNDEAIGAILTCPLRTKESPADLPEGIVEDRNCQAELQKLYRELPLLGKEQVKNAAGLLFILINYIFEKEFDFLVTSDSDKQYTRNQGAVVKAITYIKKNYHDKDISLQKVASEAALSHYYFSHIFKNELKFTFIDYLTKVRMAAAAKLLKNRSLNVNQIAYAVGYQDPNYFSKVFKKTMKISPMDYRQNLFKKGFEKQIITI